MREVWQTPLGRVKGPLCWLTASALVCLPMPGCSGHPQPPVQFEHYLGDVFLEPETVPRVEHRFIFTNRSKTQTAHLDVRGTSCGCSELIVECPEVPAGGQTGLVLRIRPNYAAELRTESARVATGLREMPFFIVSLSASIYPRLEIRAGLQRSVSVPWGGKATVPVTAVAWQPQREPAAELSAALRHGIAKLRPAGAERVTIKGGVRRVQRRWELELASDVEQAQQSTHEGYGDVLIVRYGRRELRRDVRWSEEPLIRANPPTVFLRSGVHSLEQALIRLTSETPFAITDLEHGDALTVDSASRGRATEHRLQVRLAASSGLHRATVGSLVVSTDHPLQRKVVVRVCIIYRL